MDRLIESLAGMMGRLDARDAALVVWGLTASFLNLVMIRSLSEANRRFNSFVDELNRFNARFEDKNKE
jgi:hypothetical protein